MKGGPPTSTFPPSPLSLALSGTISVSFVMTCQLHTFRAATSKLISAKSLTSLPIFQALP